MVVLISVGPHAQQVTSSVAKILPFQRAMIIITAVSLSDMQEGRTARQACYGGLSLLNGQQHIDKEPRGSAGALAWETDCLRSCPLLFSLVTPFAKTRLRRFLCHRAGASGSGSGSGTVEMSQPDTVPQVA